MEQWRWKQALNPKPSSSNPKPQPQVIHHRRARRRASLSLLLWNATARLFHRANALRRRGERRRVGGAWREWAERAREGHAWRERAAGMLQVRPLRPYTLHLNVRISNPEH